MIPSIVISVLTFPGVIVHEAAHLLFCRMAGIAVFDVRFFRFANPAGYVLHENTLDFKKAFLITMAPFFVNSAFCALFCSAAFLPVWKFQLDDPLGYFFYWLGLSIGMHAFPSTQDLKGLWRLMPAEARKSNVLAIAGYPLVALVYVLNLVKFLWADLAYGIGIGILVPLAVFRLLA
jgi:hypothetical protein